MSCKEILARIPHREPFLLVDEIVDQSATAIVCRKTFHGSEFWYRGHYPDFPLTPGVLLCEAAMQAGAVLLSHLVSGQRGQVPVVTRIDDVRFKQMVKPGDSIQMEVTLNDRLADAFFLTARVTTRGKLAVRFQFACTMSARK